MEAYTPKLMKSDEFLGHGSDNDGNVYEGYFIDGECKYFFVDDGQEIVGLMD